MRFAACALEGQSGHDAARGLLRQLYREETGCELPLIAFTERGKPYFPGSPYWFSLSHTSRHAFCVLDTAPVGIDAEELDRKVSPRLAKRVLSPREYAQYTAAPDPRKALLTFWVLKEATVKCSGEGLRGFPNETDFSLPDPRVQEWDGCLYAIVSDKE